MQLTSRYGVKVSVDAAREWIRGVLNMAQMDDVHLSMVGRDAEISRLADYYLSLGGEHSSTEVLKTAQEWYWLGKLTLRPVWDDVIREAFDMTKFQYDSSSVKLVAKEVSAAGLIHGSIEANQIVPFIESLGNNGQLSLSPRGQAEVRAQRSEKHDADLRAKIITNITQNKPQYWAFDKRFGQPRAYRSDELQTFDLDTLRQIEQAVVGYRQIRDGDVGGPEEEFEHEGPEADRWLSAHTGLESTAPMPKNAPVEAVDEFLENPATPGQEYTAQQLKRMTKEQFRDLMFSQGQSRGKARANAVARILRGLPFQGVKGE